ncbi:MAG TPA: hypothetical protein VEI48_00745, partial [Candidatus Sulfotelmatobacter sp.]|nr:hypothetical protein [Candidatus Sulfotelmatobacter sp.]
HEPLGADEAAEERYLLRGLEALDAVTGVRPVGYRAPMWETSYHTPALLARHGFRYDSSLMDADRPYRLATTDAGQDGRPAPWLIEIPIHWGLDDWEQYAYLPDLTGSGLIESPAKVMEMWRLERDATFAAGGCLVLTMHPFLSGRPSRAAALAGFLDELLALRDAGVWVAALDDIAAHVAGLDLPAVLHRQPPIPEGWLPG